MGRSKQPNGPFRYLCSVPDCGETFTRLANYRRHTENVHETEKPKLYRCDADGCGKEFRKRKQLYDHKYSIHDERAKSRYVCETCSAKFPTPYKLKHHRKRHDGYECPECQFKADTWSAVNRHKAEMHRVVHKCSYCQKEFSRPSAVKKHQRVHEMVIPCPDDDCGESMLPWNVAKHVKTAHAHSLPDERQLRQIDDIIASVVDGQFRTGHGLFECSICGKSFSKSRNLRMHKKIHEKNPDEQRQQSKPFYECALVECGKRLPTQEALQAHLNGHMAVKPIQCPHDGCSARFASRNAMQRHLKFKHMKSLRVIETVHRLANICGNTQDNEDIRENK